MEYVLKSGGYEAAIASKGAELKRFVAPSGTNCIWCGDPAVWGKTSPVLFPFVGVCRNGKYRHAGSAYRMTRHGFARDLEFICIERAEDAAAFRLTDTDATRGVYPFAFALTVRYALNGPALSVSFEVENRGDAPMYYALGGHTAFSTEGAGADMADFCLIFDGERAYDTAELDAATGLMTGTKRRVYSGKELPLSPRLFDGDALVLEDTPVKSVVLASERAGRRVRFSYENFASLGIWAAKSTARFVCLEPWTTLPDNSLWEGELAEKPGIRALNAGECGTHTYFIEFIEG